MLGSYQLSIMSSQITLGHPGGGAKRRPILIHSTTCKVARVVEQADTQHQFRSVHKFSTYVDTTFSCKRVFPQTPNFIEQTAIAPHVTGRGKGGVADQLGGTPFHGRSQVASEVISNVLRPAEICDLQEVNITSVKERRGRSLRQVCQQTKSYLAYILAGNHDI